MKDNQEKNENVDSTRPQVFSKLDEEGLQSKYVWTTRTGIYESKKKINEYIEQNSDISKFNSKEAIATFLENSPEDDEHGQLFIIFQTIATQIVENEESISKIKENFPELKDISDSSKFIAKFAIIMCEVAKIDCKLIDGFIKHYNYEKDENELKPHTWNKVQIKGIPLRYQTENTHRLSENSTLAGISLLPISSSTLISPKNLKIKYFQLQLLKMNSLPYQSSTLLSLKMKIKWKKTKQ